ncbi:MAG: polysaccharide deacetylase family protein [Acidobacteriota bacterium]
MRNSDPTADDSPRTAACAARRRSIAAAEAPLVVRRARPWRPTPLLRAAAAWHLGVAGWALAGRLDARRLRRAVGLVASSHAVLFAASVQPRAGWVGAATVRLSPASAARGEVALTFDDGPDPEVTPRVLDLLDAADARASFFCIGRHVRAHPELAREIVRRGHRLENHTHSHRATFAFLAGAAVDFEIGAAQRAITHAVGRPPAWFRPPAGMRNPLLHRHIARHGLCYAAWSRRGFDAVSSDPRAVLRRLTRHLAAGDILLLHDGSATPRRLRPGRVAVVLDVLPRLLALFERRGLRAVALPDPPPERPG